MNASTLLLQSTSKIILLVFTLSMILELAKLGKEICMLSDAMLRNTASDQFIILVLAFGTLSLLKLKNLSLYRISGKNLIFYQATNNELLGKNKRGIRCQVFRNNVRF